MPLVSHSFDKETHSSEQVATFSCSQVDNVFTTSSGVFVLPPNGKEWEDRSHERMLRWTKDLALDPNDKTESTWCPLRWLRNIVVTLICQSSDQGSFVCTGTLACTTIGETGRRNCVAGYFALQIEARAGQSSRPGLVWRGWTLARSAQQSQTSFFVPPMATGAHCRCLKTAAAPLHIRLYRVAASPFRHDCAYTMIVADCRTAVGLPVCVWWGQIVGEHQRGGVFANVRARHSVRLFPSSASALQPVRCERSLGDVFWGRRA